jgi:RecB family endonuclease NucS
VIELKKRKSSDAVVGQLLRYMGWVKKHKAAGAENVRGIIITSAPDDRIKYALLVSQGVSFYTSALTRTRMPVAHWRHLAYRSIVVS